MNSAPVCAHPPCRRPTHDSSGRCFHHRGVAKQGPSQNPSLPVPTPAAESEWKSGAGVPHPTGGYDEIAKESDLGYITTRYNRNGIPHREDGPALTKVEPDGNVRFEVWALNGMAHREDGPATVMNTFGGKPKEEYWRIDNELHRLDGPALITYDPHSGEVSGRTYALFGVQMAQADHAEGVELLAGGAPRDWVLAYLEGRTV